MDRLPIILVSLAACLWGLEANARYVVDLSGETGRAALSVQAGSPEVTYLPGVDLYLVDDGSPSEKDVVLEASPLPDDPMVSEEAWIAGGGYDIGILPAWDLVTGGSTVTVAVIDTGIDISHPDLAANVWINEGETAGNGVDDDGNGVVDDVNGYDFNDKSPDVTDDNGHGTHIAGIIGAAGNNGIGIAGVNWRVRLMPLRFTDARGTGSSVEAIEAIDYAIRNGADIINASWTLRSDASSGGDNLLQRAIRKAGEAGILFVTASGNRFETNEGLNIDENPVYPASYGLDTLIAVAAMGQDGHLASYSNYGAGSVGLAAPGDGILSTWPGNRYEMMRGTSMAAAFVSGAASLLLSIRPDLTPRQIKFHLMESAVSSASLQGLVAGGGFLNIDNALVSARSAPATTTAPQETGSLANPSISHQSPSASASGGCGLIP